MARLWSCGFELQSTTALMEWDTTVGSPTISTSIVRSGAASMRCNTSSSTAYLEHSVLASDLQKHVYLRAYIYIATMPSVKTPIISWSDGTAFYCVRLHPTGKVTAEDTPGTSSSVQSVTTLVTGQWYRIEFDYDDETSNTGTVYVNGVQEGTVTGADLAAGRRVRFGVQSSCTADIYFDDVCCNDNTGSVQNGLPGAGQIVHLYPESAGDGVQWQSSASTTTGTATVAAINERGTPDDATTYNRRTTTGVKTDDWKIQASWSGTGIGPADTITLVEVAGRFGSTSTTSTARTVITRLKGVSGGTTTSSASTAINVNGWRTNAAAIPRIPGIVAYVNPQDSAAWATTDLDTMQVGVQANTSSTNEIRYSTLWALVEYVSAGTTGIVEAGRTAYKSANTTTIVSDAFTPANSSLLLAYVGAANGSALSSSLGTVTDSLGGSWTRLAGDGASGTGLAEIWARDISTGASMTVTYDPGGSVTSGLNIVCAWYTGAAAKASQPGATITSGSSSYSRSITTTTTGSFVAGSLGRQSDPQTLTPNTATNTFGQVNGSQGDTAALFRTYSLTGTPGSITLGFTNSASGTNRVALAEILPAGGGPLDLDRDIADAATAADTIARALAIARAVADSVAAADTVGRTSGRPRAVADAAGAADTVARIEALPRAVPDTATAADAAGQTAARARTVADAATATDTVARVGSIPRPVADTLAAGEAVGRIIGLPRTVPDTATAADAAGQTAARARTVADAATATDSVTAVLAGNRAGADAVTAADTVASVRMLPAPIADSMAAADMVGRLLAIPRSLADQAGLADTAAAAASGARTVADAAGLTDEAAAGPGIARSLSDALAAADEVAADRTLAGSGSETLTAADDAATFTETSRDLADGAAAADSIQSAGTRSRGASNHVTAADSVKKVSSVGKAGDDFLTAADEVDRARLLAQATDDAIQLADELTWSPLFAVAADDAAGFGDAGLGVTATTRGLNEQAGAADGVVRSRSAARALSDALLAAEEVLAGQLVVAGAADALQLTAVVVRMVLLGRTGSEPVTVADLGLGVFSRFAGITDAVTLADTVLGGFAEAPVIVPTVRITVPAGPHISQISAIRPAERLPGQPRGERVDGFPTTARIG